MNRTNGHVDRASLDSLARLRDQLHMLVPALAVGEGQPGVDSLLAALRATTDSAENALAALEPDALSSIRAGLEHAVAGEHNESRSELLAAYHLLSMLLHHDEQRCIEAGDSSEEHHRPPG